MDPSAAFCLKRKCFAEILKTHVIVMQRFGPVLCMVDEVASDESKGID